MSDNMRLRSDEAAVIVAVDSAQVVEIGDLMWLNTDDARPASQVSYAAGLGQAQEDLVDNFLGVSMQRSRSGDTDPIRIRTGGTFEFTCASATFEIGDNMGAAANAGDTALEDQKVVSLGAHAASEADRIPRTIGKVAQREASAVTTVKVNIRSTVMDGGFPVGIASA